jgi:hypothetical protein
MEHPGLPAPNSQGPFAGCKLSLAEETGCPQYSQKRMVDHLLRVATLIFLYKIFAVFDNFSTFSEPAIYVARSYALVSSPAGKPYPCPRLESLAVTPCMPCWCHTRPSKLEKPLHQHLPSLALDARGAKTNPLTVTRE